MGDKSPPPSPKDLDQIVVTTSDYIPSHTETFTITSIAADGATINFSPAAKFLHRGTTFPIANRLGTATQRLLAAGMDPKLITGGAETRAAVALLTRNIRIVSGGDTVGQTFDKMPANYSFGGHTIFRQGVQQVQVDGVELQWLGQGGKIGHYPIHFHETRLVPTDATNPTYIKDSAVNDSMTRWYVLHSTEGVTLARNVGFKSIGHGYYLENGTETDNNFYADIGIMARAAIQNTTENPRSVPEYCRTTPTRRCFRIRMSLIPASLIARITSIRRHSGLPTAGMISRGTWPQGRPPAAPAIGSYRPRTTTHPMCWKKARTTIMGI